MKYVKTTTLGKEAIVSDEDYEYVNQFRWNYLKRDGYAKRSKKVGDTITTIYLHRIIMNSPKGFEVDHINGNRLDNRRENLRLVNNSQSRMNSKPIEGKKYKGFYWHKRDKTYYVKIRANGKVLTIGKTKDEIEAAKMYDEAARKYYGEYAYQNFPKK